MTYQNALDFLYNQFPDFSKYGQTALRPGLENIKKLCQSYQNPHQNLKYIHVAGTNGKGSICHFLASIFKESGYKVGLFTSPHLHNFTERICVDGIPISKNYIITFTKKLIEKKLDYNPSFFEITTCMAFCYFKSKHVDIVILETGLGGRLDSTNIVLPILTIITNIGLDHQQFLGNTRKKIAVEKAGIIKKNIPCVVGQKDSDMTSVFSNYSKKAPLYWSDDFYSVNFSTLKKNNYLVINYNAHYKFKKITIRSGLIGHYQINNISTILTSIDVLKSHYPEYKNLNVKAGLKNVQINFPLNGRWQIISNKPKIIIDVAHNLPGFEALKKNILSLNQNHKLYILMGVSQDKDYKKMLKLLPMDAYYIFCQADSKRALLASKLNKISAVQKPNTVHFKEIKDSLNYIKETLKKTDILIVTGSIYFVSDVLKNNLLDQFN